MRLYRTREGLVVGTQKDAGRGFEVLLVPTKSKPKLIDWLNEKLPGLVVESPAFIQGRTDAERGITANPFSSLDLRIEWERGHAHAVEMGAAKLPSFASIARPRNGAARRKIERKAA